MPCNFVQILWRLMLIFRADELLEGGVDKYYVLRGDADRILQADCLGRLSSSENSARVGGLRKMRVFNVMVNIKSTRIAICELRL